MLDYSILLSIFISIDSTIATIRIIASQFDFTTNLSLLKPNYFEGRLDSHQKIAKIVLIPS